MPNQYKRPSMSSPKMCSRCRNQFPRTVEHFYPKKDSWDGLYFYCKDCNNARTRAWRIRHPERSRELSRGYGMKCRYGITVKDYEKMLAEQHGRCKICRYRHTENGTWQRRLAVDHDHKTGKVRGL